MIDYGKRFLIVVILAVCIGLLFVGGKIGQASAAGKTAAPESWVWPADGIISDTFGTREGTHKGIDIAAELNTEIVASDGGTISKSYYSSSYGNVIFIKHNNGFETIYAHLNKRMVKQGDRVKQGEVIGKMGNTGRSRGVHLHFELHRQEWTVDKRHAINPMLVLDDTGERNQAASLTANKAQESITVTKQVEEQKPAEGDREKAKGRDKFTHIVKKNETLYSIAKKYNTTVASIKDLNSISGEVIVPAQRLDVIKGGKIHVIKQGETLHKIAKMNSTSVEDLKKLNGLQADTIRPGDSIILK